MARIARIVIPDVPHHVTQRGNRREPVFFEDGDYARYLAFLGEGAEKSGTKILAYCLMPNHVHLIVVPRHANGLRELFADAHRKYTNFINWRHKWTGHLWQGRFGSVPMDEEHLAHALRYVAQNPVRAGIAASIFDWPLVRPVHALHGCFERGTFATAGASGATRGSTRGPLAGWGLVAGGLVAGGLVAGGLVGRRLAAHAHRNGKAAD